MIKYVYHILTLTDKAEVKSQKADLKVIIKNILNGEYEPSVPLQVFKNNETGLDLIPATEEVAVLCAFELIKNPKATIPSFVWVHAPRYIVDLIPADAA